MHYGIWYVTSRATNVEVLAICLVLFNLLIYRLLTIMNEVQSRVSYEWLNKTLGVYEPMQR